MNVKLFGLPSCGSCKVLKSEFPEVEYNTATLDIAQKYGSMSVPFLVVTNGEGEVEDVIIQDVQKIREKIIEVR